ncbi:hypothetical protein [Spirillospora sp. CA-128828]|uniref:hypothetical protein n=1 Tax=Spirillospora sp. CA-128828 TaxID=3240033 RepID=UPI003D94461D
MSVTSLIGVGLGGGLSYLGQFTAQRQAVRHQANELADRRRTERLAVLREFIEAVQRAERTAGEKEDTDAWWARSEDAMDAVWIRRSMIKLMFGPSLGDLAQENARALNAAMNRDFDQDDATARWAFTEQLEGPRNAFLRAARAELG